MNNQDQKEPEFCEWCGKELPANPVNIPPRFCSYGCQEADRRDWEATERDKWNFYNGM